jgi:hypothetical protein
MVPVRSVAQRHCCNVIQAHAYEHAHAHTAKIAADAKALKPIPTHFSCSRQDLGRGIAVGLFGTNALINVIYAAVFFSFGQASCRLLCLVLGAVSAI